jgi:hypothetical protein
MTSATEKAKSPRTMTAEQEIRLRSNRQKLVSEEMAWAEVLAERQISRLLADMLQAARLECDDPTRRKIDAVIEKYEGVS